MNKILKMLIVVIAATVWLFVGPEFLEAQGTPEKITEILTFVPSIIAIVWVTSWNQNFMACEYRAWRRIFGK